MLAEFISLLLLMRYRQCFDITPTVAVRCLHQALPQDRGYNGTSSSLALGVLSSLPPSSFLLLSGFCFVLLERHFAASISLPFLCPT